MLPSGKLRLVMASTIIALDRYYDQGIVDEVITGALTSLMQFGLWAINCIQDYSRVGMQKTKEEYGEVVERYIRYILDDRHRK